MRSATPSRTPARGEEKTRGAGGLVPAAVPAPALALLILLSAPVPGAAAAAGESPRPEGAPAGYEALGPPVRLAEASEGLLLATEVDGVYLPAPGLETEVTIRVSGLVARTRVRQRFHNPTGAWVEGVYLFPLPDGAAVDRLRMVVGERVIEGRIREREEAAATYRRAKRSGRRASLVEQERPNLFTTSVANVGPDEELEVVLSYQEELRYDAGRFELRFPMVAAPRYVPGPVAPALAGRPRTGPARLAVSSGRPPSVAAASGPAAAGPRVPDACRLVAPRVPAGAAPINPVELTVLLDAGFPVDRLGSPSHELDVARRPGSRVYRITPAGGPVPADRDFVLEWAPTVGREPDAALLTETVEGSLYALLMLLPPAAPVAPEEAPPREAVFVVDTSGSMHGESIRQAKAALTFALERLRPVDRFNVIRFASDAEALFSASVPAGSGALAAARGFVDGLRAEGGTNVLPALRLALETPPVPGAVRQVVFVTDGAVGNEAEVLALLRRRGGTSRLFTVGIGSAPNGHLMRRAAEEGRGSFTYVGRVEDVRPLMEELFAKLESPVLTDLEVRWSDPLFQSEAEAWPQSLPDLYAGEPVVLAVRLPEPVAGEAVSVELTGRLGGRPWTAVHAVGAGDGLDSPGVAKLWARRKIAALTALRLDGVPEEEVRRDVVELALHHHLVSKFTSLVAVEVTPAKPASESVTSRRLPVNLPAGWGPEKVVGSLPQGGTEARLLAVLGLVFLAAAAVLAIRSRPGRAS